MNGHQKMAYLQSLPLTQDEKTLIDYTVYEMSEGNEKDINKAFKWACETIQVNDIKLTLLMILAIDHIRKEMSK